MAFGVLKNDPSTPPHSPPILPTTSVGFRQSQGVVGFLQVVALAFAVGAELLDAEPA